MTLAAGPQKQAMRAALEDVLIDRAAWVYARLKAGHHHQVELHEETLTQDLLLDISAALPAMRVTTFTRKQESLNGADWQWDLWFEGQGWFGLRMQAKRLKALGCGSSEGTCGQQFCRIAA